MSGVALALAFGFAACAPPPANNAPAAAAPPTQPEPVTAPAGADAPPGAADATTSDAASAPAPGIDPPAPAPPPPSPGREPTDDPFGGPGAREHFGPPAPPRAVEEEEAHLAATLTELEAESFDGLLARAWVAQLAKRHLDLEPEDLDHLEVRAAPLDGPGEHTLLWFSYGGLRHLLVVLGPGGAIRDQVKLDGRLSVRLRDLVRDETEEIVVDRILGTALSTYPTEWILWRVTDAGKLRRLLALPKSHSSGSKYRTWSWLRHFEFGDEGRLSVKTVLSDCEENDSVPDCPLPESETLFRYSPAADRYLKIAASSPGSPRARGTKIAPAPHSKLRSAKPQPGRDPFE